MDLSDQCADRIPHHRAGRNRVPPGSPGTLGNVRRGRRAAALAGPGDVPVRRVFHPGPRHRGRPPCGDTGDDRADIDRRLRRPRVASRRSSPDRPAALPQSRAHTRQRDNAGLCRRIFRRRPAAAELFPAGAAPNADAGGRSHDPARSGRHADHAADRSAGGQAGPGQDRAGRDCADHRRPERLRLRGGDPGPTIYPRCWSGWRSWAWAWAAP